MIQRQEENDSETGLHQQDAESIIHDTNDYKFQQCKQYLQEQIKLQSTELK